MRFQQKMLSIGLLLFGLNFLVACSSGDSSSKKPTEQVVDDDLSAYSEASCLFKFDEGDLALSRSAPEIKSTYFNKKFDISLLKAVVGASASEVIRFAGTTGVSYFKTQSYKTKSCEFLASLPKAPSDLENEFAKGLKDATILGLYLGLKTPELPTTDSHASIIVRRDGNKWILVHEYMHHLFQIQAEADGLQVNKLKDQIKLLSDEYDEADKALKHAIGPDRIPLVKTAALKLGQLNEVVLQILKQYMLEEMTIETTLGELMENYRLNKIHPKQRINGAAYIISSSKKAAAILESLSSENTSFKDRSKADIDYADLRKLEESLALFAQTKSEMDTLVSKAKSYLNSIGLEYKGLNFAVGEFDSEGKDTAHVGCSHSEIPAEVQQAVNRFNRKR